MRSRLKTLSADGKKGEWAVGDWGFGGGCQYKPWAEKMSKTYMRKAQGDTGMLPARYSALKIDGV